MRLLFCCEFYFPSVGGVQEVMRQIAERLVRRGHEVTVATTRLANRLSSEHNGVKIVEFGITGNLVRGMDGEVERYRKFVTSFDGDALLIKATQQWTFDALWPVLDSISARKVLIPCGFSGLYEPSYVDYFQELPNILRKFDHLIFYAENYRDVDFARENKIDKFSILANGACEIEFGVSKDPSFRQSHNIPKDSFVILTVGSLTGVKGHKELLEAFVRLNTAHRHVTFIMNGNPPPKPMVDISQPSENLGKEKSNGANHIENDTFPAAKPMLTRAVHVYKHEGISGIKSRINKRLMLIRGRMSSIYRIWSEQGWIGLRLRALQSVVSRLESSSLRRLMPASVRRLANPTEFWMAEARKFNRRKTLIISDFPRDELVQAYMAADLFVFASNIEYSPLVLFESVAASTPFLSVPVGNAEEIAKWTGGGIICPAEKDERGYTRADPGVLAQEITRAIEAPEKLQELARAGRKSWQDRFTWDSIARKYESILQGEAPGTQGLEKSV